MGAKVDTRPPASIGNRAQKGESVMRTFANSSRVFGSIAAAVIVLSSTQAGAADDMAALAGLKQVKVAFDIKEGDAKGLLKRLDIIDETRESLIKQGVTPHFILAFRGGATALVQTDAAKIKPEDRLTAEQIAQKIEKMSRAPGVEGFEQCAVAVRELGTSAERVLPQIHVVGNGFISLMAYQSKGYAYISP
jgi:intracellular sulfur oxidation DsrE/DsrF family protein